MSTLRRASKISPFVVGLAGGTASGKSTLAKRLVEHYGSRCLLLSHDRYYFDVENPLDHNYDHPDALDSALCSEHVRLLRSGKPVELPNYDFATHSRTKSVDIVSPAEILIVEGILVLSESSLRDLFDLSVFVHAERELRLERRILRDVQERGRDRAGVLAQFKRTVSPMHDQYVEPSRRYATLQVSGDGSLEHALSTLVSAIDLNLGTRAIL